MNDSHWLILPEHPPPLSSPMNLESQVDITTFPNWDIYNASPFILWHLRCAHTAVLCYLIKDNQEGDTNPQKTSLFEFSFPQSYLFTFCHIHKDSNAWKTNELYGFNAEDRKKKDTRALRCWHWVGVITEHIFVYIRAQICLTQFYIRPLVMAQSVWEKKYADPSPSLPDNFLSMVVELYCSYDSNFRH